MRCPKCDGETSILLLTSEGQCCRVCREKYNAKVRSLITSANLSFTEGNEGNEEHTDIEAVNDDFCGATRLERGMALGCFVLAAAWAIACGGWVGLVRWFAVKRVCAWCEPQHRLGGNPFAGKVSHGICARALFEQKLQIIRSQGDKVRRDVRLIMGTHGSASLPGLEISHGATGPGLEIQPPSSGAIPPSPLCDKNIATPVGASMGT